MSGIIDNINRFKQIHQNNPIVLLEKINADLIDHKRNHSEPNAQNLGINNIVVNEILSILSYLNNSEAIDKSLLLETVEHLNKLPIFPAVRAKLISFNNHIEETIKERKTTNDQQDENTTLIPSSKPENHENNEVILDKTSQSVGTNKEKINGFKYWKILTIVISLALIASLFLSYCLFEINKSYWVQIQNENKKSQKLIDRFEALKDEYEELMGENVELMGENVELTNGVEYLTGINFRIGKNSLVGDRGFDKFYKMFFRVYKPILLKSVFVRSKNTGNFKIEMYNLNDTLITNTEDIFISSADNWQKVILNFPIYDSGHYYLSFTGDISLLYHSSDFDYSEYKVNGIIEITGSGNSNENPNLKRYYQYFYDWNFSLLVDPGWVPVQPNDSH